MRSSWRAGTREQPASIRVLFQEQLIGGVDRTDGAVYSLDNEGASMKLTYDPRRNVAYLRLQEKTGEVDTIRVSDELNVDLAPDGTVFGIELLNANEQLQAGDDGVLVVVNEAVGDRQEIPLAR